MAGLLAGKVALITGGARGIGKAVALAYASQGAQLAICSRTPAELDQACQEIRALGAQCEGWPCDVSDEDSVQKTVAAALQRFGRIDVLVNNAGVMTRPAPLTQFEVRKWDYTIAVNLRGPFLGTRAVAPVMMKQRGGSIINVSSSIGRGAYPNFSAYAASKWGLEGLTATLAAELKPYGIIVNSVDPGYVATKMTGYQGGDPNHVPDVFVFLASDRARNVSGRQLSASGWRSQVR